MRVNGKHFRTIWVNDREKRIIRIIDQRYLPHKFVIEDLDSLSSAVTAIKDMHVRGAGLIGATAAYGMYLAARDNLVPFFVALPSSTFDWELEDGIKEIPIEERDADEVKYIEGLCDGEIKRVLLTPQNSRAANYSFDVTPARLVTRLITERGICKPDRNSILEMFPENRR